MSTSIVAQVMKYFTERPGQTIYLDDIVDDLKETPERIRANINNVRHSPGLQGELVTAVRGNAWRYNPSGKKASQGKRVFQELGTAKDSTIIIEDEDGNLFRATEL